MAPPAGLQSCRGWKRSTWPSRVASFRSAMAPMSTRANIVPATPLRSMSLLPLSTMPLIDASDGWRRRAQPRRRQPATRKLLSGSEPDRRGEVNGEVHQLRRADLCSPGPHLGEEVPVELRQVVVGTTRKLHLPVVEEKAGRVAVALDPLQVVSHRRPDAVRGLMMLEQLGEEAGLVLRDRLQIQRRRDAVFPT